MSLPKFEYIRAKSLEEAANLKAELAETAVIYNGGTDVIPLLTARVWQPDYVIDIKEIPELDKLTYTEGEGLRIGCLVKLSDVEDSVLIKEKMPAVQQAAHYVASRQIRCKGTMAGNICNASPSCDTAPIEIAMNAVYTIVSSTDGEKEIEAKDFFKGVKKTCLAQNEVLKEIFIPELKEGEGSAYFKHAIRKAMDLAIIGVAAWVKMNNGIIEDVRFAVGGAATTPVRAYEAEEILKGQAYSDELLEKAAQAAADAVKPISDVRASAEYRRDMVRVFTKRAFRKAMADIR